VDVAKSTFNVQECRGNGRGPALALEIILLRLVECCFRCQQIAFVKDIPESRYNIVGSVNVQARAFHCPRSRIQPAQDREERLSDSIEIVNSKSPIGISRTQKENTSVTK
jgi:hypothetical protein